MSQHRSLPSIEASALTRAAPESQQLALLAAGEVFGGAERQILTLVRALKEFGINPLLLLFHDNALAEKAREAEIRTVIIGARGLIDIRSIALLRKTLEQEQIHLVNVHGYRASAYLALAAKRASLQVVKTEHGAAELRSHRLRDRWRPLIYRALESWGARKMAAKLIYVTQDLQTRCSERHKGMSTRVIYNGIAIRDIVSTCTPQEYRTDRYNMVAVGRLEAVKAFDVAIAAMSDSSMPREAHLHIVGDGPEQTRLAQLVSKAEIEDRVTFHGFRRNVYDYIAHADVLLMPSLHEGLPYTLLEAMAMGTPVIASRVGGLAEVLNSDENAILVPAANPVQLADAVQRLHSDRDLAMLLTHNARDLVETRFSAAAMANEYLAVFAEALQRGVVVR